MAHGKIIIKRIKIIFLLFFCAIVTPLIVILAFILGGVDAVAGTDFYPSFYNLCEKLKMRLPS